MKSLSYLSFFSKFIGEDDKKRRQSLDDEYVASGGCEHP